MERYIKMTLENFIGSIGISWTVLVVIAAVMIANTIAGYLHSQTTNTFDRKYFNEHTSKKAIILGLITLVTLLSSVDTRIHELANLMIAAYSVVEFKSFRKHYLEYQEVK